MREILRELARGRGERGKRDREILGARDREREGERAERAEILMEGETGRVREILGEIEREEKGRETERYWERERGRESRESRD